MTENGLLLHIRYLTDPDEPIVTCAFGECQQVLKFDNMVIVNGQIVRSYEQLLDLMKRGEYRDKGAIEVVIIPDVVEGG